ncbi:autoinducer 2 ABC transporter substrate-binding protein [Bacillus sp. JJ1609]|uniref:autoinducer 2 ABC transporter substrate-binding protein n=1 Tax=Bacillus sp. JJ1609 TaxID=3122977 RepID=UPI003000F52E
MKRIYKRLSLVFITLLSLSLIVGCAGTGITDQSSAKSSGDKKKDGKYKIATVVKLSNSAWFERMENGVKKFADETGVDAYQIGPQKADAALQVQMIEDLIAQNVDAIVVVPFSPEALEPVLKKARDKGIVVISHEASNLENVDYDIEAFDNAGYGEHLMDKLGQLTNGKGEYATFVGNLTTKSHNEWIDAAVKLQEEKYPSMKLVSDRNESNDDQKTAYEATRELLKKYPNLKGIQGSGMPDAAGAALAVEEMGLTGKVKIVGTSLVSVAGKYLESGSLDMISFWDPADAGYAANKLAYMILEGKEDELKDGVNLGAPGYENLKLDGKVFYGEAWIDVTKENMGDYDF